MRHLLFAGLIALSAAYVGCGDDTGGGGGSGGGASSSDATSATTSDASSSDASSGDTSSSDASSGDTSSSDASSSDASASTGQGGGGACDEATLHDTVYAYCDAGMALWDELACTHGGCDPAELDGLVEAVSGAGCSCEMIAYYECEIARWEAEDTSACTCEGESAVVCPDEDACADVRAPLEACLHPT